MFVKSYRYKIKNKDFEKSVKISKEADKIYEKYISKKAQYLFNKGREMTTVLNLEFYESKKEYELNIDKINEDKEIIDLFQKFFKLVYNKKIIEENFETK